MVKKHYENQNGTGSYPQKTPNWRKKSEQHNRSANHQNNSKNQRHEAKNPQQNTYEPRSRDGGQQRGHNRDRSREMISQRSRQSGFSGRSPDNYRSRSEETIEDIKQDIIRLEKEIDLEIKEIKSLKL
jgi:hypothetical protein